MPTKTEKIKINYSNRFDIDKLKVLTEEAKIRYGFWDFEIKAERPSFFIFLFLILKKISLYFKYSKYL